MLTVCHLWSCYNQKSNFTSYWQIICPSPKFFLERKSPWQAAQGTNLFSFLTSSPSTCVPQGVGAGSWTLITSNALRYAFLSPQQQINSTYLSLSPRSVRVEQLFMERKGQGVMGDVRWLTAPFVFPASLQVR